MNIFKKALIVALSVGLISVPTVTKEVEAADKIYIAGSFQGWNPGSTQMTYNSENNRYEYFSNFTASQSVEFKFTKGSWETDWGNSDSNISFVAPVAGQYYIWSDGVKDGDYGAIYNDGETTRTYFSNTSNWTTVYAYNWDLTGKWIFTSAWPGTKIKKVDNGDDVYYYDGLQGSKLIFNNNDSNQTSDLVIPVSGNNLFTYSTSSWDTLYKEHSIVYNYGYEDSNYTVDNQLAHGLDTSLTLYKGLTRDGYNLIGWSSTNDNTVDYELDTEYKFNETSNLTLYAVWEEKVASQCTINFDVNGTIYTVYALEGQNIEECIPTDKIAATNINVVSWDKTGVVTGDTTITATSYYTTIEKTEAQLGFDYTFEASTRIWFQVETSEAPVIWAQVGDDPYTGNDFPMTEDDSYVQSDSKKQFYCDIPLKFNKIQFKFKHWENNGEEVQYPNDGLENRDYYNNARWYNSAESTNVWQKEPDDFTGITSVSNVALRFSTSELLHSDFLGISSYGVDVQVNGKTQSSINEYVNGNGSFEWGTVLYNIDENNYNTEIKAVAWVKIGTVKYPLSDERLVTVADLADTYANDPEESKKLSAVAISACQYIVDSASK